MTTTELFLVYLTAGLLVHLHRSQNAEGDDNFVMNGKRGKDTEGSNCCLCES
jgi:hypothetical protein